MQLTLEEWLEGQSMHSACGAVLGLNSGASGGTHNSDDDLGSVNGLTTIDDPVNHGFHSFDPGFDCLVPFDNVVNRNYHPAVSVPNNITATNYVVDQGFSPFASGFSNLAAPNATVYLTPYARIPSHSIAGARDNVADQGFPLAHPTTFSFNGIAAPYSLKCSHQDFMNIGFGSLTNPKPVESDVRLRAGWPQQFQ